MNRAAVILYIELVSMGSVKATLVEPMNVFCVAILKGASHFIRIHNHPAGTMKPSEADKDILEASTKYVSTYQLIEKMRREEQIEKEAIIKAEKGLRLAAEKKLISAVNFLINKSASEEEIASTLNIPIQEVKKIIRKGNKTK